MSEPPSGLEVAGISRRVLGILIDWLLSMVIAAAIFPDPSMVEPTAVERVLLGGQPFAVLGIWAAQHLLLVASLGTTIGHRVTGLKVVRSDGSSIVGLPRSAARTALVALVIPALLTDGHGVGLHDSLIGTVLVRSRSARPSNESSP